MSPAAAFVIALFVAAIAELACLGRTAALVMRYGHPLATGLGTLLGNALLVLVAVIVGSNVQRWMPESWVRVGAAVLFISLGVWMLFEHR